MKWWYILTAVLVACIVGYIVYYGLEQLSTRRARRAYKLNESEANDSADASQWVIEHTSTVSIIETKDGGEIVVVEDEEITIITDDQWEKSAIERDLDDEELKKIANSDEVLVAQAVAPGSEEEENPALRKHRVKNIAEWVSRDDILQDKHEKNLQKVKYEALLFKQRNDMAGYEKKLIEGLILDPDDVDIFRQLADFYITEWKYTKALSMFRKILTFDPNDHHALWQIGEIYIEQWQYEDAQVFVEKALALSPDNPKYYISLIDICIAKSEFQTALVYLEKIVALRPRNISYLMALGEMYEKLGRVEEAKQTYFRVLEIDPLHTDVKHILKKF